MRGRDRHRAAGSYQPAAALPARSEANGHFGDAGCYRAVVSRLPIFAALAASACADPEPIPPLACDGVVQPVRGEAGVHVPPGTPIEWSTNPPATGTHYPFWVKWNHHYTALDRGYWMHNAEHGGVVLLYRCPEGCPEVIDALIDVVATFSTDGACQAPVRNRLIVVNDPQLPEGVQVAAVGWNAYYTASCFDPYVRIFAGSRYNKAPEDLCVDGIDRGGAFIDPR
jgi:hypothetical protein